MIKQRPITIKTENASLTVAEMGDVIVNKSSATTMTLPTPSPGLWYRFSNANSGVVTISYNSSSMTTLKQAEQCLCLSNGTSGWFFSKGGGAMTKSEIEAVLIGEITSHTHPVMHELPTGGSSGQSLVKASENDYDVTWQTVSSGGTSSGTNGTAKSGTGTISSSGWVSNTGDYSYKLNVAIDGIISSDIPDISVDKDDLDILTTAQLSPSVDTYDGGITFYAKSIPSSSVSFTYVTLGGATVPKGGAIGQALIKLSSGDFNVGWTDLYKYKNPIDIPPATAHSKDDEFDSISLDSKWSWVNQGSTVATVSGGKLTLDIQSMSDNISALIQTAPTGDFTVIAKLNTLTKGNGYYDSFIGLRNSASNKYILIGRSARPSGEGYIHCTKLWTSDPFLVGGYGAIDAYFKIIKTGTTVQFCYSLDGISWINVLSETVATFLGGVTDILIAGYRNNTSSDKAYAMCEWFRVTET